MLRRGEGGLISVALSEVCPQLGRCMSFTRWFKKGVHLYLQSPRDRTKSTVTAYSPVETSAPKEFSFVGQRYHIYYIRGIKLIFK